MTIKTYFSFLFVSLLLFCWYQTLSQNTTFDLRLNSDLDEVPQAIVRDFNDGFISLVRKGVPESYIFDYDSYLYSISNNGDTSSIMLHKQDTLMLQIELLRIDQEPRGYLLTGWGFPEGGSVFTRFNSFAKLNENLEPVWEKIYSFNYSSAVSSVQTMIMSNGDILHGCSVDNNDLFLFRMDANGDSLNFRSYSDDTAGELWGLSYSPDSTHIWAHQKWAYYVSGSAACSVTAFNDNLEFESYTFYPDYFDIPFTSIVYPDNKLISSALYDPYDPNTSQSYYMISGYTFDSLLTKESSVSLTIPDTTSRPGDMKGIDYYYPDCIYIGGTYFFQNITGNYPNWIYISRLNENMDVEFEKYIGGDFYYWLFDVTATKDGGVLLTGTTQELSPPIFENDAFYIKLDSTGCITGSNINSEILIQDVIVYPNPGEDHLYVRTAMEQSVLYLYDEIGNLILTSELDPMVTRINTEMLDRGTYFYSILSNNNKTASGQWIKK